MNVVIDTNVLVSAALKDRTPEAVVLFVVDHQEFTWVASRAIIDEYMEVLSRPKFRLPPTILTRWRAVIGDAVKVVPVKEEVAFDRDPADAKFLSCCLSASARYLITGDRDFSGPMKLGETIIISASLFRGLVCGKFPD